MTISGLLGGTPFYFISSSLFVMESMKARELHRDLLSDLIPIVSLFLVIGVA
jgi:hypothetical protein